ncbi:MAG: SAM-dependent methyltransferase [Proteobacteria bacterium]|nr:MAG: SAM-dependent methyltransferase [Pseudomonadota bacterium]
MRSNFNYWRDKLCSDFARRKLAQLKYGELTVKWPDGREEVFGKCGIGEKADLKVIKERLFYRLVKDGGIGFGEAYVDGDFESSDLTALLRLLLNNFNELDESKLNILKPFRWLNYLRHTLRSNNLKGSRKNIQAHYDLSNEMFALFLDDTMTYSSGIYRKPEDSLKQAQLNKLDAIIEKAQIKASDHVLEIGSGWGSFAIRAAMQTGCRVTSITLSQEQLKLARKRAFELGLSERVKFELIDYRKVQGSFDKVVSIEMLEAVGKEFLPDYFGAIERLLKPDGIAVVQVITMPDSCYDDYLTRSDWIQEYIFPGSHLPSIGALQEAISGSSKLVIENMENICLHYARTLREWRENFVGQKDKLEELGYDQRFQRTWAFYLCCCEAEFATRWLGDFQIVLTRANNNSFRAKSELAALKELPAGKRHEVAALKVA